mmetsp:Transcript_10478/g.31137  ORF Transcript_10478/g.31137 Transcript_10478/m.31137 type:complete len:277 (+) Transcript_10478:1402-2232(+)
MTGMVTSADSPNASMATRTTICVHTDAAPDNTVTTPAALIVAQGPVPLTSVALVRESAIMLRVVASEKVTMAPTLKDVATLAGARRAASSGDVTTDRVVVSARPTASGSVVAMRTRPVATVVPHESTQEASTSSPTSETAPARTLTVHGCEPWDATARPSLRLASCTSLGSTDSIVPSSRRAVTYTLAASNSASSVWRATAVTTMDASASAVSVPDGDRLRDTPVTATARRDVTLRDVASDTDSTTVAGTVAPPPREIVAVPVPRPDAVQMRPTPS